jgi:hypothetical protein
MASPILFTYSDGSKLVTSSAKELIKIPIWKGNRVKDGKHVAYLKEAIGTQVQHLDKGYHVIKYNEIDATGATVQQAYIIDGQHRATVLIDHFNSTLCEPDFPITYIEVTVDNEAEAIAYFNKINNVKPICYKEDPVLVANRYIEAIVKALPGPKKAPFFRDKATHRPYIVTDRLRDKIIASLDKIKCTPAVFARRIVEKNGKLLSEYVIALSLDGAVAVAVAAKDKNIMARAIEIDFALGVDSAMSWFSEVV